MSEIENKTITDVKNWILSKEMLTKSEIEELANDPRAGVRAIHKQWIRKKEIAEKIRAEHDYLLRYERSLWEGGITYIAGIDEVGRGPLAGPVIAAAVILPPDFQLLGLTDSKKLSLAKREFFYEKIKQSAVSFGIGEASPFEIDQKNIYQATKLAMMRAVANLHQVPDHLLVDAMTLETPISQESLIKGDANSLSIAAASVLAKVTRDRLMTHYHEQFPEYGFNSHAGYGTKEHLKALSLYGATPIHRKSFAPVRNLY